MKTCFFFSIAVSVHDPDQMCVHDNVESAGIVGRFVRFLRLRIDCKHIYRVGTVFEGLWKFGENGISFSKPWKSVKTEWCLWKFVNLWSSEKAREKLSAYQSETAFPKTKQ